MERNKEVKKVYLTVDWAGVSYGKHFTTRTTRDVAIALVRVLEQLTQCVERKLSYTITETISPEFEEKAIMHMPEQLLAHFAYSMEYPGAEGMLFQMERDGVVECSMFANAHIADALKGFFQSCSLEMGKQDTIQFRMTRPKFENLAYIPKLGNWSWALQLMTQRLDEMRNDKEETLEDEDAYLRIVYGGENGYLCHTKHKEALRLKALIEGVVDSWKKGIQSQILYDSETWMRRHAYGRKPLQIVQKLAEMFHFNAPERTVILKYKRRKNEEDTFTFCGLGLAGKICDVLQPYADKCGDVLEYEELLKVDGTRTFEKFRRMDEFMGYVAREIEREIRRREYEEWEKEFDEEN